MATIIVQGSKVNGWGWYCTCGAQKEGFSTAEEADSASTWHKH